MLKTERGCFVSVLGKRYVEVLGEEDEVVDGKVKKIPILGIQVLCVKTGGEDNAPSKGRLFAGDNELEEQQPRALASSD